MNPEGYGYFIAPRGKGAPILVELLPGTGGGGGPPASQLMAAIVFRPGAASSGFFVETWPEVQAVMAASPAGVVFVDDGIVSPALVPGATGITDFQGRWELRPYRGDDTNFSTLQVSDGATLKSIAIIRGTLIVQGDCQSATPSFDFDYTPNVVGTPEPICYLKDDAGIGCSSTNTQPCLVVPAGATLQFDAQEYAGFVQPSAVPFIALTNAASVLAITNHNGTFPNDFVSGAAGTVLYRYNSESLLSSFGHSTGGVPLLPGYTGTYTKLQDDTQLVIIDVLTSATNVLAGLLGGFIPTVGKVSIQFEGFGGSGGGGGGQAGAPGAQGVGGGGSGGCVLQAGSFDFVLSNQLDVNLGSGGTAGAAGMAPGGAGGDGGDGNPSNIFDATATNVLVLMQGSTGGQGAAGGVPGDGGCQFANTTGASTLGLNRLASNIGFPGVGGSGGAAGANGNDGNFAALSLGVGATGYPNTSGYVGGLGGASAALQGGGGGGGGQGPYQAGQAGGASSVSVGGNGVPPAPNTGAGAGGGAGGTGAADNGGAGAVGSLGRVRLLFIAPQA